MSDPGPWVSRNVRVPENKEPDDTGPKKESGVRLSFFGDSAALSRLVLRNTIFTLLTLTVYRFWGRTLLRQYFWERTGLQGEPFEYRGTPMEIFFGFLRMLAYLGAGSLVFSLLQTIITEETLILGSLLGVASTAFYVWFWEFARYSRMRYLLRQTSWRGIRFGIGGKVSEFAGQAFLYQMLNIFTLWLTYPFTRVQLERLRLGSAYFGDHKFEFSGQIDRLYAIWGSSLLLMIVASFAALIPVGLVGGLISLLVGVSSGTFDVENPGGFALLGVYANVAVVLYSGILISVYVLYKVRETSYIVENLSLQGVSFRWKVRTWPLVGRMGLIIMGALVAIILYDLAFLQFGWLDVLLDPFAQAYLIGGGIMVVLFGVLALKPLLWDQFYWRQMATALEIQNPEALMMIISGEKDDSPTIDGFTDGFDLGGF